MDLDAFRAPGGQMHGALTKAILNTSFQPHSFGGQEG
jgi:hypothetical protein